MRWLLSQLLLHILSGKVVSAKNRVLQWALLKKIFGQVHPKLFQAKYCLPFPQLELQLCSCVKDLHAAVCVTGSSSLGARGAHAHQNVVTPVKFSRVLFPSCTKHGLHVQIITKPCTTPHWKRKCTESAYLPVENPTCRKVSVTTVAHTTTHTHFGEVYRESLAHHFLLKSETELAPFLILSRSYSWFRLNLDLWN